jgi:hypothetical protein
MAACLCEFRGKARFPPRSALCGSGKRSKAEFADGFDGMRITIGKPALAAATRLPGYFHRHMAASIDGPTQDLDVQFIRPEHTIGAQSRSDHRIH